LSGLEKLPLKTKKPGQGAAFYVADRKSRLVRVFCDRGKNLVVTGINFDSGAVLLIDGISQKTLHDSQSPGTTLTGKKSGKNIASGTAVTLQVRNSDGATSPEFPFTRP
jgi:hypothetical protein